METSPKAFSIREISKPNSPFSRSSIYEEIKDGRLRARKFGRRTVVLEQDYREWLETLPAFKKSTRPARNRPETPGAVAQNAPSQQEFKSQSVRAKRTTRRSRI